MNLQVRWVDEAVPGARWQELFRRAWPSYREWFLREGDAQRPDLAACRAGLAEHMPELVPTWEGLTRLAGGDETVARMLSLVRPTPFLAGCSQAVWTRGAPLLVRNYDYHPLAWEGTFLRSRWRGTRVLAASDCLWGALDGMNEHGLVVALSFGGSRRTGAGFGIPLILRYVLETCRTVPAAIEALRRLPCHMAYNVSLLDRNGEHAVARLAPGREAVIRPDAIAANHQQEPEWPEYARATDSPARVAALEAALGDPALSREAFVGLFLRPPLYSTRYERGMGTLYTCVYEPVGLRATWLWPGGRHEQSLEGFQAGERAVALGPAGRG